MNLRGLAMAFLCWGLLDLVLQRLFRGCTSTTRFHQAVPDAKHWTDFSRAYDPVVNRARIKARIMKTKCKTHMPALRDLVRRNQTGAAEYAWRSSLSRYVMYHNINRFLVRRWSSRRPGARNLSVLDAGGSRFLKPFRSFLDVTRTDFPATDMHRTQFADASFDVVATDQMLEHVLLPHLVLLEMRRLLRPGGIAIVTSVAYNPLHELPGVWHDYWRFMPDGLLALSMPFKLVKLCGSWGNAQFIATRADGGVGSKKETEIFAKEFDKLASTTEKRNPVTVWIVLEK